QRAGRALGGARAKRAAARAALSAFHARASASIAFARASAEDARVLARLHPGDLDLDRDLLDRDEILLHEERQDRSHEVSLIDARDDLADRVELPRDPRSDAREVARIRRTAVTVGARSASLLLADRLHLRDEIRERALVGLVR